MLKEKRMMSDKKVEIIAFDYGATLDTNGTHWYNIFYSEHIKENPFLTDIELRQAYVYAERTLSRERLVKQDDTFRETLHKKVNLQMEYLLHNHHIEEIEPEQIKNIVDNSYSVALHCTSNAKKLLQNLKNGYKLVMISNFYGNLQTVLVEFGLRDFFLCVAESAVVGYSKPDERLFLKAFESFDTDAGRCMMIGDSYNKDIIPAKRLGYKTIWLKGRPWQENPVLTPLADETITDLSELERILI